MSLWTESLAHQSGSGGTSVPFGARELCASHSHQQRINFNAMVYECKRRSPSGPIEVKSCLAPKDVSHNPRGKKKKNYSQKPSFRGLFQTRFFAPQKSPENAHGTPYCIRKMNLKVTHAYSLLFESELAHVHFWSKVNFHNFRSGLLYVVVEWANRGKILPQV